MAWSQSVTKTVNENEEGRKVVETKLLYLEAYSRRGNIKFMNIAVDSTEEREDAEETLRSFLERDLGLLDARTVEIQRVHRSGKGKDGGPRPILARFLKYKDVQKIFSLGHRLKETGYQMFRDYPAESDARSRWKPSKKPEKTDFRQLSVNPNQISYTLEGDYGQ